MLLRVTIGQEQHLLLMSLLWLHVTTLHLKRFNDHLIYAMVDSAAARGAALLDQIG